MKMKSKKGQVQSGETVVVVIIVIILIIVGLVFATKGKKSSIEESFEQINEEKAMEVAMVASSLNELKCTEYSTGVKSCLDYHRLLAFSKVVNDNQDNSYDYYYYLLGNSRLEVKVLKSLDMDASESENITLFDYKDSVNKSSSPVFIPSIVHDSVANKNYFAIMEVRTFS